jgi:multiple sugar transport system substrate-binding protein
MQPFGGDSAPLNSLFAEFERQHPGVTVVRQTLPNASDIAHQYFLTALEGEAVDFDLFVADVVWIQEFARAGWIADLSEQFPPEKLNRDFFPAVADAVTYRGRVFAVPYYVDVGLLYYRRDLVPTPPTSYLELEEAVERVRKVRPSLKGYLWQGKQYEGLVCNVFENLWGELPGSVPSGVGPRDETLQIATAEATLALGRMRRWIEQGISPHSVTSATEEDSRRAFQEGTALFQRNWPYSWGEMERPGSAVRGKVGFGPLPSTLGAPGAGALGGYQLAVNAHSPPAKRALVLSLLEHLTSHEANLLHALHYGRNPPRRAVYEDDRLRRHVPFTAALKPLLEVARSRPATPYYNLLSDALQSEFSAVIAGLRTPASALERAQRRLDHLTRSAKE